MLKQISAGTKLYQKVSRKPDQRVAVVDVDDVLFPCTQIILNKLNQEHNRQVSLDDLKGFHVLSHFPEIGKDFQDLIAYLISGHDYMNVPGVYDYAKPVLDLLRSRGFYIAIVSSRGFHPEGYRNTFNYFKKYSLPFDSLATVGMGSSKIDFVYDHISSDIHLVIDDNAQVIDESLESDAFVIKTKRAWNSHLVTHGTIEPDMDTCSVLDEVDGVLDRVLEDTYVNT